MACARLLFFSLYYRLISNNIKTTDSSSEQHLVAAQCSSGKGPGIHVDATWHTPPTSIWSQTKCILSRYSLMAMTLPSRTMSPSTAKTAHEWPKECDKKLEIATKPLNFLDLNEIEHLWDAWTLLVARHYRAPPEILCRCLNGSEPSLIHSSSSTDYNCSRMSHGCSFWLVLGNFSKYYEVFLNFSTVKEHSSTVKITVEWLLTHVQMKKNNDYNIVKVRFISSPAITVSRDSNPQSWILLVFSTSSVLSTPT